MSNNKYGLVEWTDVEIKQPSAPNQGRKDLYMRLESGPNELRLITKPHEYLLHRYKSDPSDPGFGERVLSSIAHGRDPLMEKNKDLYKPKRRWLIGCIDRKTQSYKILDIGVSVFKAIQELVRDDDWGDPQNYDVNIKVDKAGGPNGYYSVIPKKAKPLTAADLEIKQMADLEELKRKCTPPTPEQVEERIAAIDAKSKARRGEKKTAAVASSTTEATQFDFPAEDQ